MANRNDIYAIAIIGGVVLFWPQIKRILGTATDTADTVADVVGGVGTVAQSAGGVVTETADNFSAFLDWYKNNAFPPTMADDAIRDIRKGLSDLREELNRTRTGAALLRSPNTSTTGGAIYSPPPSRTTVLDTVRASIAPNTSAPQGAVYTPPPASTTRRVTPTTSQVVSGTVRIASNNSVSNILSRVANPWRK